MTDEFSLHTVHVQKPPMDRFAEFLQRRGKRITRQRRLIVQQVFSHHDHFDADELMDHLQEMITRRQVSRPTVYRTLSELVDAGLLRKMSLGGRSVYEHEYGYPRHDHLYCQICNRLIEFHTDRLDRLCDEVALQHDFQVRSRRMFVMGICSECRRRELGGG